MKNIQLLIAYDGTGFLGWQHTIMGPSIEQSLQSVLEQILQEKITLQAASRTDAGVHAEGQVVNFFTTKSPPSLSKLHKSLNALLPPSIVVLQIEEKNLSFHPTLDNRGKEYHYYICNTPYQKPKHRFTSWHVPLSLDIPLIEESLPIFLGTHDFTPFCNTDGLEKNKNPICTLDSISYTQLPEGRLVFSIKGDRFLFRMVRILMGTLIYIGLHKITLPEVKNIFIQKKRSLAGVTAPAHGLHLIQVFYKNQTPDILLK